MAMTRAQFRENGNLICDGYLFKELAIGGVQWLDRNKEQVNQLNVFPVPDGDTGTNMLLTMRGAFDQIADIEEPHVGRLAKVFADGALRHARGNSGVILSQIWAGAARALEGHELLDAPSVADACVSAVDLAYRAVEKPVEGTILTVSRDIKDAVVQKTETQGDLVSVLKTMVFAGRSSLRRTPEMLPLLKKAGVVDSGGQGLVFILEGMLRALCGKDIMLVDSAMPVLGQQAESWQAALVPEDEEGYGYDVQFLMHGRDMDVARIREDINSMGWSTLVVGDSSLIKVHVHVHNPGEPLNYAITSGADIDDVVVENMHRQYQQYVQARAEREQDAAITTDGIAVITVASGGGMKRLFTQELGAAYVITGGQTMNPSTGDFLSAIDRVANEEVILLPNNKNVLLSARQAAEQARHKRVRVVPSATLPQGIAAMFEYANASSMEPPASLDETTDMMTEMLSLVVTGEITRATRDVEIDGLEVRAGQFIGLIDDVLKVAGNDLTQVSRDLLRMADTHRYERVTLYYGEGVGESDARALVATLSDDFPDLEFEVIAGGQPLYPYIISLE
ncbi:MAG: DAK2 domain-containing protein [Anaerolineae bacterium]|nr:DAK2 domain-containing protein [Anaerolineae bacterium]